MPKEINVIGQRYSKLTVLECQEKGKYICLCDCGNKTVVRKANLLRGHTKSCGCLHSQMMVSRNLQMKGKGKLPHGVAAHNLILKQYLTGCKNRNIAWNLPKEHAFKLFSRNCHYCNMPPSQTKKTDTYEYRYNGIDRIDNSKGYEEGNVVTCCRMCNVAKNNYTVEEFLAWVKRVYEFQNKPRDP